MEDSFIFVCTLYWNLRKYAAMALWAESCDLAGLMILKRESWNLRSPKAVLMSETFLFLCNKMSFINNGEFPPLSCSQGPSAPLLLGGCPAFSMT